MNVNIDQKTLEMCLKSIGQFGNTQYQNICTGEQAVVYWGALDWFGFVLLSALGIAFLGMFLGMLYKLIFDF